MEIVTVLAIIGLISAISFPIYLQLQPKLALDGQTKDLVSDLRWTQQLAVTRQAVYQTVFNISENSYLIKKSGSSEILKSVNFNSKVGLNSITGLTDDTAAFTPTGAAVESGNIILENSQEETKTILIKPSGYVRIQ